jgi:hypothetical protein
MGEVKDLDLARRIKEGRSTSLSPEEVLRYAAADVIAGKASLNPTKALVLLIEPGPTGYPMIATYRSNLTYQEETAILEVYRQQSLSSWAQEDADA